MKKIMFLILSLGLMSCEDTSTQQFDLIFDMKLPQDDNGYYHLELDQDNWQTLHRVTASIQDEFQSGIENFWVEWDSNLYWYIGDTLGYVVKRNFSGTGYYVSYDTTYVTYFSGFEVPTTNAISYSNGDGEISNMIAPVQSMIGDTLSLFAYWYSGSATFNIVLE